MSDVEKWKGLGSLAADAIEHGSRAVEKVQLDVARRRFGALASVPVLSGLARAVHVVHDAAVTTTYANVRLVTRALGTLVEATLTLAGNRTR